MYQRKIPIDFNCGLTVALEVIGSKWKFCILDEISKEIMRPRDLAKAIAGISKRVLHEQLRELELHGIVSKKIVKEMPLHVEYRLTATGRTVLPLITAFHTWGQQFAPRLKEIHGVVEEKERMLA